MAVAHPPEDARVVQTPRSLLERLDGLREQRGDPLLPALAAANDDESVSAVGPLERQELGDPQAGPHGELVERAILLGRGYQVTELLGCQVRRGVVLLH